MLKSFPVVLAILTLACLLVGCSSTSSASKAPPASSAQKIPVLEVGTTAEAIRQRLGEPAEIKPMETPEGKAEIWVYRFEKSLGKKQVVARMKEVPAAAPLGSGQEIRMVMEPEYTQVDITAQVTMNLLIFRGKLLNQVTQEKRNEDYR